MESNQKFYVVVREDMKNGDILAQSVHIAIEFCLKYPGIIKNWHNISNYVAVLSIKNEMSLVDLLRKASSLDISYSLFREPDMNNEITAVAFEPTDMSKKLCSNLSLAMKEKKDGISARTTS